MPDFMFDAWAGKSLEEVKQDARRLNRAMHHWQMIALKFAGAYGLEKLPPADQADVRGLADQYRD